MVTIMQTGTLSLGEALSTGLSTTVIGLSIVFSVLIILMLVLMVMKKIFYKEPEKTAAPAPVQTAAQSVPEEAEETVSEDELIAVLTAAVAASLNTSTYNLQIKSYRRISSNAGVWQKAGIADTINSRII